MIEYSTADPIADENAAFGAEYSLTLSQSTITGRPERWLGPEASPNRDGFAKAFILAEMRATQALRRAEVTVTRTFSHPPAPGSGCTRLFSSVRRARFSNCGSEIPHAVAMALSLSITTGSAAARTGLAYAATSVATIASSGLMMSLRTHRGGPKTRNAADTSTVGAAVGGCSTFGANVSGFATEFSTARGATSFDRIRGRLGQGSVWRVYVRPGGER